MILTEALSLYVTVCDGVGRSSDGRNVPVSVDCAHFHYVEPPVGWNTDHQTDTVDSGPATENPQRTGHVATGKVDNEPSPHTQSQSQGQVPGDEEPHTRIPPGASNTKDENDNTGDVA